MSSDPDIFETGDLSGVDPVEPLRVSTSFVHDWSAQAEWSNTLDDIARRGDEWPEEMPPKNEETARTKLERMVLVALENITTTDKCSSAEAVEKLLRDLPG
jgi:hypothetical protein